MHEQMAPDVVQTAKVTFMHTFTFDDPQHLFHHT